ncbi:Retinol dehydrogenase 7 [Bulinus truncatus]|nr:Retinol dehydrogenase 7 [Bulinus truncatus]
MGSVISQYAETFGDLQNNVVLPTDSIWFWLGSLVSLELVAYLFYDKVMRSWKVGNYGDKFVMVTGCDSGLGQELAFHLDSIGFNVFAGCLTEEGKINLASNGSKRLVPLLLDISKNDSIEAAVKYVRRTIPENTGLWGLVNNAGIVGNPSLSEFCTRQDFQQVYNVNLFGMSEMCRHFLPLIRRAKGRIVNMSSATGRVAFVTSVDTTTKYAIEAYSDILRRELYTKGVKVSIIEAGAFQTPIFNEDRVMSFAKAAYDKTSEEVKLAYGDALGNCC